MEKKPDFIDFDKNINLLSRIEEHRKKIHDMINNGKNIIFDDETIKLSQHLDKLIVEYLRGSGGERSGQKE